MNSVKNIVGTPRTYTVAYGKMRPIPGTKIVYKKKIKFLIFIKLNIFINFDFFIYIK